MKRNSDRLLKILIVIATVIILSTLAVLAFLNFSAESSRNSREQSSTTVRRVTSSTVSISTTQRELSTTERKRSTTEQTEERPNVVVKTQRALELKEALEENANEAREEDVASTSVSSKSFATQAEAHAYGQSEINRISGESNSKASYVINAVRDADGKVVSWEANVTVG